MLSAENITIERGASALVCDVTFTVSGGDCIWVRGANGIGKTSLLRTLAGLSLPSLGTVRRTKPCAFLGHNDSLKPDMNVREMINFWRQIYGSGDVDAAMRNAGIHEQAAVKCENLSAGQKRRASFARLLLCQAPLWILDEPAAPLDAPGRALINTLMDRHISAGGAVIIASHRAPEKIGGRTRILSLKAPQ